MVKKVLIAATLLGVALPAMPAHAALSNVAVIPVGGNPLHLDLNASTNRLYVTTGLSLVVIDVTTNTIVTTLSMPALDVAVNEQTNRVYVTQSNKLIVLDGATNTLLAPQTMMTQPYGVAVDELRDRVFVADHSGPTRIFTGSTLASVTTIGGFTGHHVTIDPSFTRAYVTTNTSPFAVKIINANTFAVEGTVGLPTGGHDPFLSTDLNRLYVPSGAGTFVFNTTTLANLGTRPGNTHGAVSPITRLGYVSTTAQIEAFNASTLASTSVIGPGGNGVTLDPRTNRVYVADPPYVRVYADQQPSLTTGSPQTAIALEPIPVTATVRSAAGIGIPGLTVSFSRGVDVVTAVTGAGGVANATLPAAPAGNYLLGVATNGTTGWLASSTTTPLTVNRRPATLTLTGASDGIRGSVVSITAELRDQATGTGVAGVPVAFTLGSLSGSAPTNASGFATWSPTLSLVPGSYTLTASTPQTATHAATSATSPFQVRWEYVYLDAQGRGVVSLNTITDEMQVVTAAGSTGIVPGAAIERVQTPLGVELLVVAHRSAPVTLTGTFRVGDTMFAAVAAQGMTVTPLAAPPTV